MTRFSSIIITENIDYYARSNHFGCLHNASKSDESSLEIIDKPQRDLVLEAHSVELIGSKGDMIE